MSYGEQFPDNRSFYFLGEFDEIKKIKAFNAEEQNY